MEPLTHIGDIPYAKRPTEPNAAAQKLLFPIEKAATIDDSAE